MRIDRYHFAFAAALPVWILGLAAPSRAQNCAAGQFWNGYACQQATNTCPLIASGTAPHCVQGSPGWWYVKVGGNSAGSDALCATAKATGSYQLGAPARFSTAPCISASSRPACDAMIQQMSCSAPGPPPTPASTPAAGLPAGCSAPWWLAANHPTGTDATWMSDDYARICGKALREIAIPGTHDTGTFGVTSTWMRRTTLPNQVFAPDMDPSNATTLKFLSLFSNSVDKWATAQDQPVRTQLADVIRALDIRVCVDGFGNLLTCHTLYAAAIDEILTDVRNFVATRPGELVLLEFNHFWDGAWQTQNGEQIGSTEGLRPEKWTELVNLIHARLDGKLVSNQFDPTTRLTALQQQATPQHTNQVIVRFDSDSPYKSDAMIWTGRAATTWIGNEWHQDQVKADTLNIVQTAANNGYPGQFYSVGASITPTDFVTLAADPTANFPTSLLELADQTNPVVLGWFKNEWTNLPLNVIRTDFYQRTDLVKLAKFRNGIPVDWTGTKLGSTTAWNTWHAPIAESYGRGAGVPMVCGPDEEQQGAVCYPKCRAGFTGTVTMCQKPCPDGWRNDGLTCFRDASIVKSDASACPWYDVCGVTLSKGCSKCPAGYANDGCTCRIDPQAISRERYDRGVGQPLHACPAGDAKDPNGLLCYPVCKD